MFLFLGGIVQIFWERMDLGHCSDFCFSTAIFPTSLFGLERRVYDKLQGADKKWLWWDLRLWTDKGARQIFGGVCVYNKQQAVLWTGSGGWTQRWCWASNPAVALRIILLGHRWKQLLQRCCKVERLVLAWKLRLWQRWLTLEAGTVQASRLYHL